MSFKATPVPADEETGYDCCGCDCPSGTSWEKGYQQAIRDILIAWGDTGPSSLPDDAQQAHMTILEAQEWLGQNDHNRPKLAYVRAGVTDKVGR